MARYRIEQLEGDAAFIDADNWMMAVSEALDKLGLSDEAAARIECDIDVEGHILVRDPASGSHIRVWQVADDQESVTAEVYVELSGPVDVGSGSDDAHAQAITGVDPALLDAPDPLSPQPLSPDAVEAPEPGGIAAFGNGELTDDDLDRLMDLSRRITDAGDLQIAASVAIDVLLRFVPAESASVLLRDVEAATLRFVAARGPRADALFGVQMPDNVGIAGLVVRSGTSMLVREAATAPHHYQVMDDNTGYHTRTLLAVPLRTMRGVAGVIELLNPFGAGEFEERHLDAATLVAGRLAQWLD